MKTFITTCIILSMSTITHAQAKISFENTTIEYKQVKKGSDGARSFSFKNTGDEPLSITKVESTSQHLTVTKPNGNIAPGKSGEIKISYDTKKKGPIRRTITVHSNAKNQPVTALKVKGSIVDSE